MRRFYIVCSFMWLAYPCQALSFHAPQSKQEKGEFRKAQDYLDTIKKINAELEGSGLSAEKITNDKRKLVALYDKTTHAVILAYGIKPNHEAGTIVRGAVKGAKSKKWDPVFDDQTHRIMTDKGGKEVLAKEAPAVGYTWSDGQITLGPGAFEGSFINKTTKGKEFYSASPALLASLIIHETVHFEQYTTPGRGDKMSRFDMDLEAYKVQLASARKIGLNPSEVRLIGQGMIKGMGWIKAHPNASPFAGPGVVLGAADLPDSDIERAKNGAEDSFLDTWKNEASQVADDARAQKLTPQEIERRKEEKVAWRKEREEERRKKLDEEEKRYMEQMRHYASDCPFGDTACETVPPQAAPPPSRELLWNALGEWTQTACRYITPVQFVSYPRDPSVTDDLRPGMTPRVPDPSFMNDMTDAYRENERRAKAKAEEDQEDRAYLKDHFVVMNQSDIDEFKSQNSLSRCQSEMADLLSQANGPVDVDWMLGELGKRKTEEIDKTRDSLDLLVHALIRGIPIVAAAIVKGISTPFVAIGQATASPGNSGGSGGGSGGSSGNSHVQYHAGLADSQLRGIASGSMSFDGGM